MAETPKRIPGRKPASKASKKMTRRRTPKRVAEDILAVIDRLLSATLAVTQNGKPTRMTALEAIVLRLLQEEAKGNARAPTVLRKYRRLIRLNPERRPEVLFIENDYSRSLPGREPEPRDG